MSPTTQPRRRAERSGLTDCCLQRCPLSGGVPSDREPGLLECVGDGAELGMGSCEHRGLSGADEIRVAPQEESGDLAGFVGLVVADDPFDRRSIGPVGDQRTGLIGDGQHVNAGADDLRGAPVVDREADDLDTGEARLDLDEQRGVGAIEPVDRL